MSDKPPKPFHVGTKVEPADDGELALDHGRVATFSPEMDEVVVKRENGTFVVTDKSWFVHAVDGSPLGAFEPLTEDQWIRAQLLPHETGDPEAGLKYINASLRGEVPQ